MARIRSIKPEFPHDETLGRVSRDARLLFILLWTCADDAGRSRASGAYLRGQLFPFDEDITGADVEGWLKELEDAGRVRSYRINAESYCVVTNWARHQRVDNASRRTCPDPPWDSEEVGRPPNPSASRRKPRSEAKGKESPSLSKSPTPAEGFGEIRLDRDRDRDREPLSHPQTTQEVREAPVPAEAGEEGDPNDPELKSDRVRQAAALLAQRDLADAVNRGTQIRDRAAWIKAATRRRMESDADRLGRLHDQHSDWTAKRLANAPLSSNPMYQPYVPEGFGNGAVKPNLLRRVDDEIEPQ